MKYIKSLSFFLLFSYSLFSCKTNVVANHSVKEEVNYIPYYLKVYEADSLYITKNYQKSYDILDKLFKEYKPINMNIYYEVLTYSQLKIILDKKIDKKEILEMIGKYGFTQEYMKNDSIFNIYNKKNKSILESEYAEEREKYIKSINIPLRNKIKEMKIQDQWYRKKDYRNNMDKQDKIDSINQRELVAIFDKFGFPSHKLVGNFSVDNSTTDVLAMLLHTKDDVRVSYYMPKILDYIKKGEAESFYYANLQDQLLLYNGKPQYYGSYDNKVDIPLKELNKRRKTIGMPNYGYEKWRTKKLYPDEQF